MIRSKLGALAIALLLAATAGTIVYAFTPSLWVSAGFFECANAPNWAVEVSNADPNSLVYLEEYRDNGSSWVLAWAGNIGYTDGSGFRRYATTGPSIGGFFYAQATVNGQVSNTAPYWVDASGHCD